MCVMDHGKMTLKLFHYATVSYYVFSYENLIGCFFIFIS